MNASQPLHQPTGQALLADLLAGCAPAQGAPTPPMTLTFNFAAGASLTLVIGDAARILPPQAASIGDTHAG